MGTREKSALYPNATWEDCLEFIRTIDSFKLKSVSYMEVAKRYGLSSTTTKSLLQNKLFQTIWPHNHKQW